MFYMPDKITLLVEATDAQARFSGPSSDCLKDANIPCTIDFKKSAAGDLDNRVRTDAIVVVELSPSNEQAFRIGAEFVVARLKNMFFRVMDVDIAEGVFGGAGTIEMRCIRKNGQLVGVEKASVRQQLAAKIASKNRPGGRIGPGTGPEIH